MTFYSSLTADRSCSHNDARLRTPYLADAYMRSTTKASFNPPGPSDTAKSVNAAQMTLEMYNLAKLAHVLCTVSGERRTAFRCAEKREASGGGGVNSQNKAGRADPSPELRAHRRGSCWPWNVSRANLWATVQTRH